LKELKELKETTFKPFKPFQLFQLSWSTLSTLLRHCNILRERTLKGKLKEFKELKELKETTFKPFKPFQLFKLSWSTLSTLLRHCNILRERTLKGKLKEFKELKELKKTSFKPFKLFQLFQLSSCQLSNLFCTLSLSRCINLKFVYMYTFSFERLEAWKMSRSLTRKIYSITGNFPDDEKFILTSQIRRAIISVCSNLAEGSSRKTKKDQAHFYNMAFSSLIETLNQLIICRDLEYLDNKLFDEIRDDIHTISLMINNLIVYVEGGKKVEGDHL